MLDWLAKHNEDWIISQIFYLKIWLIMRQKISDCESDSAVLSERSPDFLKPLIKLKPNGV